MRLWHQSLIPHLPGPQLRGQHQECCALRGLGWGKKHSTVNYVFKYDLTRLYMYHIWILGEMIKRGYSPDLKWANAHYRGKNCQPIIEGGLDWSWALFGSESHDLIYPEHDDVYLQECIVNLRKKGIEIDV